MNLLKKYQQDLKKISPLKHVMPLGGTAFLVVIFFLLFNVGGIATQKSQVLGVANEAYGNLAHAYEFLSTAQLYQAQEAFQSAQQNFSSLEQQLIFLNQSLAPISEDRVDSALHLARAGNLISGAGNNFTQGLADLMTVGHAFEQTITLDSSRDGAGFIEAQNNHNIRESLEKAKTQFGWAITGLHMAEESLLRVRTRSLPENLRQPTSQAQAMVVQIRETAEIFNQYIELFSQLFSGHSKTYLLIMQNTAEQRPSGGFIGTYGILRIKEGQISSLLIESIYEIDGRLLETIEPPEPIKSLIGERWYLRDANWWPDFSVTAQNLTSFYEKSGRETVDGVIALNPRLFENIFNTIEPIEMSEYGVIVTGENFFEIVQEQSSFTYDQELNKPKKFIADLTAAIFSSLPELETSLQTQMIGSFFKAIIEKDLMLYSRYPETQNLIKARGLSGELLSTNDFSNILLISNANLGGNKNDRQTLMNVNLKIDLRPSLPIHHLKITRDNQTPKEEEIGDSHNYMRVYVPLGSKLISSDRQVDVFDELDRTVFGFWQQLPAQSKDEVRLRYQLPENYTQSFHLVTEKNPGQDIHEMNIELLLPNNTQLVHTIGVPKADVALGKNRLEFNLKNLTSNHFLGFIYK